MNTDQRLEYDSVCQLCAKIKDVQSEKYCSSCLDAIEPLRRERWIDISGKRELTFADYLMLVALIRLIQFTPIGMVVISEAALTHIMKHPVFLPTDISLELLGISQRFASSARRKAEEISEKFRRLRSALSS